MFSMSGALLISPLESFFGRLGRRRWRWFVERERDERESLGGSEAGEVGAAGVCGSSFNGLHFPQAIDSYPLTAASLCFLFCLFVCLFVFVFVSHSFLSERVRNNETCKRAKHLPPPRPRRGHDSAEGLAAAATRVPFRC